jgi:hypothetical protein
MNNMIINPWEMADTIQQTVIPNFVLAKYITLRIAPPREKTIREGVVSTLAMLSYVLDNGKEINTIEVSQGPSGFEINFPFGKRGISATKYRGMKSIYKFRRPDGTWFQIGSNDPKTRINEKFTVSYAEEYLSKSISDWKTLSAKEHDQLIDEYLESMFMFGLAMDYNLPVEGEDIRFPEIGMVTDFYRRFEPPVGDDKYGRVTATKFAPAEGKDTLSGDYTLVDAEIAAAILTKLQERESTSTFNPKDFGNETSEDII